ncbi:MULTISPECIES: RNA-guided endonuclease TnpB family protein [unclassified Kitasatospora]|uniref:RNA-guided endonuclease InsQ/TnpB family protein n=1 Tax=unclassified Kitasatospora TaxID=2633591 RepID=UPI00070A0072|nr:MULTISPECIES: RNA-guided endonuclease TnpB family protein [unclassified Kitasatospora]KQV14984.1 transposase [Kitasatospora sp. Root107]KRB60683.1 transposase [Kitasatospora sp. Root187]
MRRAYKFLLRPTECQTRVLTEMLADHCSLYNGALQERRDAYRHPSKTSVKYGTQSAQLKEIRAFDPERQGRWSFSSQQATLRRLDKAFAAFFRRVRSGETPGYPRFRGTSWFDTVEFPKDGDGCRWDSTPQDPVTRVRLQGVGHVRVHQHRPVKGRVKTVSVKREGRRWYVILSCDDVPAEPLLATGATCGIDMGVVHFLTTSEGEHVPNPRHGKRSADALARAQRALKSFPKVRRDKRSARHRRAVEKVAVLHRRVRRQRVDHAHKTANTMLASYDVIAHERLSIANMVRASKPKPDPERYSGFLSNGSTAKAGLNKSVLDAGWGVFLGILAYKAESAGRGLIPVDPRNSSRTCPRRHCGHVSAENRPTQQKFQCVSCGYTANADRVGALNVAIRAGLVLPHVA